MPTASGQLRDGKPSPPTLSWELSPWVSFSFLSADRDPGWGHVLAIRPKKRGATRQPHADAHSPVSGAHQGAARSEANWSPIPPGRRKVAWMLRKSQRSEFRVTSDKTPARNF